MAATTIKVPSELRDRLNAAAKEANTTVAGLIEQLIAAQERAERFRQIKEARAKTTPQQWAEYNAEDQLFERASLADLERFDPWDG
jgi:hypothetical protein